MPETARILQFPARNLRASLPGEARACAEALLSLPSEQLTFDEFSVRIDVDVLHSVCLVLRERLNSLPAHVSAIALRTYEWLASRESMGFFDERDYFLGELALLCSSSSELTGQRAEAEIWLDRAEASFRHVVNAAPQLARVSLGRLNLRYAQRRYSEVLELLPSVARVFQRLGMYGDLFKCQLLEAISLKESGRRKEAVQRFTAMIADSSFRDHPRVFGSALVNLGDLQGQEGDFASAMQSYRQAVLPLNQAGVPFLVAHLKATMADTLRRQGEREPAINLYREAANAYGALSMPTWSAYVRVLLAEALLEVGRPREAEWEVLAALPTIEEQGMAPEGLAAVAILRESVRQRKTDPKALLQLREYLQAKN